MLLNVRDQVSHPYKTTGKITLLYTSISKFLEMRWKIEDSEMGGNKHSPSIIFL